MRPKRTLTLFLIVVCSVMLQRPVVRAGAVQPPAVYAMYSSVTTGDLIAAMNALRVSNGYSPLVEDPIIDAVAQSTAQIMAANQMSSHIGDVRGRIAAAGYGGGGTVWATENFAYGNMGIDEIMVAWADPAHMLPATNGAYCNVGAGIAKSANGFTYYILQAAYVSGKSCGSYTSSPGSGSTGSSGVSQIIIPVKVATPDAEGRIYHEVQTGQSLWAIAIAYHITIHDLEVWNNISRDNKLQIGQRLFIPTSSTQGYFTPTPVGMVVISTPDSDGKVVHVVQAYQTLITIADAYHVTVDSILALNGIQVDWPLQIGQKLLIYPGNVTPSPTPRPLTPIEKLTPASDGNYYHIVQSGQTLSWIASLYDIPLADLMAWNGLNNDSIILPDQKLLLQVTPPATVTPTPGPPTATATATPTPRPPTPTRTPTSTAVPPTPTATPVPRSGIISVAWPVWIILIAIGLVLLWLILGRRVFRRTKKAE